MTSYEWVSLPVKDEPIFKTIVLFIIIFLVTFATAYSLSMLYAALAFILLVFSVRKYFLPTKYKLNNEGVSAQTLFSNTFKPWKALNRYNIKNNLILFAGSRNSRTDSFRALFLRLTHREDEALIKNFIERHLENYENK